MKKTCFAALAASFFALTANAQLVVDDDGKVALATDNTTNYTLVSIGDSPYNIINTSGSSTGLQVFNSPSTYNVGVYSNSLSTSSATLSCGVYWLASGGNLNTYLYGVLGNFSGKTGHGAGVFACNGGSLQPNFTGSYAGYFQGNVNITGSVTVTSVVTPSDEQLKENVTPLSSVESGANTLDNVLNMNVVKYNYKDRSYAIEGRDTLDADYLEECAQAAEEIHYGLLAQELREIYPDLVKEGQDGFLGINYQVKNLLF